VSTKNDGLLDVIIGRSYGLLNATEQTLLARLSVFADAFTHESAIRICGEGMSSIEVLDTLSSLVAKSLVIRGDDVDCHATFHLLQVIREFGQDRLREQAEADIVRRRHAQHFRELAERAAPHLTSHDQQQWLAVLDREKSNIRSAISWCSLHEAESAVRMVGSLWRWWYLRGHYTEGRTWAARALRVSPESPAELRAPVLAGAGVLALLQCDYDFAQEQIQDSLELYSELQDNAGASWALARLGSIACERAEYRVAEQLHERALVLASRAHDQHSVGAQLNSLCLVAWLRGDLEHAEDLGHRALDSMSELGVREGIAWALINMGAIARYRGDLAAGELLLRQSLEISSEISYREGIAWSMNQLGVVTRLQGNYTEALASQSASLAEHRHLGDRWRGASVLDELAAAALATGDPARATASLGAAERLRRQIGTPVPTAEQPAREETLHAARAALGPLFPAVRLAGSADPAW
jgi:tetratricopeptide (TPR) repeat protein